MNRTHVLMASSVISALALIVPAAGQTMIGSQTVGEGDLAAVQAHCDTLAETPEVGAAAAGVSGAGQVAGGPAAATNDAEAAAGMAANGEAGADASGSAINLDMITLEDCQAAGMVEMQSP